MLTQIHIRNLVTIQEMHLDLPFGTTVLTGETGAGKSIIIDAIEIALGSRITGNVIRAGQEKADVSICFDVSKLTSAREWLKQYDLETETNECIIRRIITTDGRSRCFINDMPSTLQPLRELSELLINIHGQHEHQTLLKPEKQCEILDKFANHYDLINKVHALSDDWHKVKNEINSLESLAKERETRGEFLKFQLRELEELDLHPNEFQDLDQEHKQLANADELLQNMNICLNYLSEDENSNAFKILNKSIQSLEAINRVDPKISVWIESLKNALIYICDTEDDLRRYVDSVEQNPERLMHVEKRISLIFEMGRKHKVSPHELYDFHKNMQAEYSKLANSDERITALKTELSRIEKEYYDIAKKLTLSREKFALKLSKEITEIIHTLSLPHGKFSIHFEKEPAGKISANGQEKILFQISTNVGQNIEPLHKVVSGGELSRIALAIHIATSSQHTIPVLIFDEVDVGISGGTAEIVGKLLRQLGNSHQVLCITHQPQVAAQGHHHLLVEKIIQNANTHSHIRFLEEKEKISELARMLGGIAITKKTLDHAKEMRESCEV